MFLFADRNINMAKVNDFNLNWYDQFVRVGDDSMKKTYKQLMEDSFMRDRLVQRLQQKLNLKAVSSAKTTHEMASVSTMKKTIKESW